MIFLSVLSLINFLAVVYFIFLFYRKYRQPINIPSEFSPKISLLRFNPFNDLGGDQSFILCLLDNQNSGVIITSLHSRHHTRIYAKPIKFGKADGVTLSAEEKQALGKIINHHEPKNN